MEGKLTDKDKARVESGEIRWRKNVGWTRYHLAKDGYIKRPSHGIWEITDKGREFYNELKSNIIQA